MAFIKDGVVIRRCLMCGITNDVINFFKQKDTRSGVVYTHNICIPCKKEYQSAFKRRLYYKNPQKYIDQSIKWRKDNKDICNKRKREKNKFFKNCLYAI